MASQETATTTAITAEMEETIARISSHKGVEGVMIMSKEGIVACCGFLAAINCSSQRQLLVFMSLHLRTTSVTMSINLKYLSLLSLSHNVGAIIQSTLDEDSAKTHSAALSELTAKASHIVGLLNRDDELTFLRIRSKQREIMVGQNAKCNL